MQKIFAYVKKKQYLCSRKGEHIKKIDMKKIVLWMIVVLFGQNVWATLPDVHLRDVNGQEVSVASLAQEGKPVIISFFATWCKPCMRELKAIHELYPDWQDETGV